MTRMIRIFCAFGFCAGLVRAQEDGLEALRAKIEKLKAEKLAWREIDWKDCPLESIKESREKKKPVLVWVFLGKPRDERC